MTWDMLQQCGDDHFQAIADRCTLGTMNAITDGLFKDDPERRLERRIENLFAVGGRRILRNQRKLAEAGEVEREMLKTSSRGAVRSCPATPTLSL